MGQPGILKRATRFGKQTVRSLYKKDKFPPDFTPEEIAICQAVAPYTETSRERVQSVIHAVQHVVKHEIPGSIVECGVFKGGSTMAMALALLQLERQDRDLYLFDTFEGMSQPTKHDVSYHGDSAQESYKHRDTWAYCPLEGVKQAINTTGYNPERIHYVKGMVEDTIPQQAPDKIALLRLDTDWYESTKHEFEYLYPRLVSGGILIIDDYGHWKGAREATDEYIAKHNLKLFLQRIDYTGRIVVKP